MWIIELPIYPLYLPYSISTEESINLACFFNSEEEIKETLAIISQQSQEWLFSIYLLNANTRLIILDNYIYMIPSAANLTIALNTPVLVRSLVLSNAERG